MMTGPGNPVGEEPVSRNSRSVKRLRDLEREAKSGDVLLIDTSEGLRLSLQVLKQINHPPEKIGAWPNGGFPINGLRAFYLTSGYHPQMLTDNSGAPPYINLDNGEIWGNLVPEFYSRKMKNPLHFSDYEIVKREGESH